MRMLRLGIAIVLFTISGAAQAPSAPAPTDRLTFEVASIKRNKSGDARSRTDAAPNGRVMATNVPLNDLVRTAFLLQPQEMVMGERAPAWITTARWDIEAKAAGEPQLQRSTLDCQEQLGLRLQPRQAPVDVFVIESAEQPAEN